MIVSGLNPGSGLSMNTLPCCPGASAESDCCAPVAAPSLAVGTDVLYPDGSPAPTVPDVPAVVHALRASGAMTASMMVIPACSSTGPDQRRIHDVLADEPDVPLVGPDHLAHQQVVRVVVAHLRRLSRHGAALFQNDLMRVEKP